MMQFQRAARAAATIAAALVIAAPAAAQSDADRATFYATRAELEQRLAMYEQGTQDGFSEAARAVYQDEIDLIRTRLRDGDFQVGDKIDMTVVGEETLTGTFVVAPGRLIHLDHIGDIPLTGKLRSELQPFMHDTISAYVRNPDVRVHALFQVALLGNVANPGYHWVSAETLLTDVVMNAGGPTDGGDVRKMKIERDSEVIWRGDALQAAIQQGRTLDQLNLRSGDQIEIPSRSRVFGTILGTLPYLIPAAFALFRLF